MRNIFRSLSNIARSIRGKPKKLTSRNTVSRKPEAMLAELERMDVLRRQYSEQLGLGVGAICDSSGEAGALRYLARQLPAAAILYDVGANKGDYACLMAEHFRESSIFAFEPSSHTYGTLQKRTAHLPQVRTFGFALSSGASEARLFTNAEGSGLASLHKRRLDHFGIAFSESETVTVRTIDTFSDEQGVDRIDFLKLDVEGHELEVLKGAEQRLATDRISAIQFEFGGCNIDSRTFFQDFFYLLSERYYLCRILQDSLYRVDQYREVDEVFVTTNYLALHKERFTRVCDSRIIPYE